MCKLCAFVVATQICELVQAGIDVYIPYMATPLPCFIFSVNPILLVTFFAHNIAPIKYWINTPKTHEKKLFLHA